MKVLVSDPLSEDGLKILIMPRVTRCNYCSGRGQIVYLTVRR